MSNIHHNMAPALDYSLEAKKLWERLGINPEDINKDKRGFNPLDIIYKSPEGGCVYVGGERAAKDLELLTEKNINAVVNCTDDIRNYHVGRLSYYTFNVAWWRKYVGDSEVGTMMISLVTRCLPPGRACQVPVPLCGLHRGGAGGGPQCAGALPGRGSQSRNNGNYVLDAFCRIGKS